jgi:hypothetical protein
MAVDIAYAEGMLSVWMYGQLSAKRVDKSSAGWS